MNTLPLKQYKNELGSKETMVEPHSSKSILFIYGFCLIDPTANVKVVAPHPSAPSQSIFESETKLTPFSKYLPIYFYLLFN